MRGRVEADSWLDDRSLTLSDLRGLHLTAEHGGRYALRIIHKVDGHFRLDGLAGWEVGHVIAAHVQRRLAILDGKWRWYRPKRLRLIVEDCAYLDVDDAQDELGGIGGGDHVDHISELLDFLHR